MDLMILMAQTVSLALIAGWITTGVRDNILFPTLNETYTAEVLSQERLRQDYPEAFEKVAHRAIASRSLQVAAFRLIVAAEFLVTLVLWVGVAALVLAILGIASLEGARVLALAGALMFTTLWAMFIVVGNHFSYWFGHEGAQNTHFQLTLWGFGNVLFLALA